MMRLFRNKRGVSPVVSAVIMILVVMISMSALFAFFVNYSRDFQEGSGSAVLESMTVEDVWFKDANSVEVWIYNFGRVEVTVTDVYIDNNAVEFKFAEQSEDIIFTGGHGKITVNSFPTRPFEAGASYGFKIVTARGTSFEGVFTW